MLTKAIKDFPKQFEFEPEVQNAGKLKKHSSYVIGGMGGSGLVAGILRALKPELDIAAHHEYGLPTFIDSKEKRLFIAISYSGNTEETISFFQEANKKKLPVAAITTGGKLLKLAKEKKVPYVKLPSTGIQPRMSLGFMLRAALKLMAEEKLFKEAGELAKTLKPSEAEALGKAFAKELRGKVPVIYSSRKNQALAYNWKIKFNETGKIPAFYNTFPELNHNEMTGFDVVDSTRSLSGNIHVIILKDPDDDTRIKKRMKVLENLYVDRYIPVSTVEIDAGGTLEKIFSTLIVGDWTAYYLAKHYSTEPEEVPMVEEFKKLIK